MPRLTDEELSKINYITLPEMVYEIMLSLKRIEKELKRFTVKK